MIGDAVKRSHSLMQMRDQVANRFGLEELQLLVFDFGLDWEEVQRTGKTARVRDLIVQLGRSDELFELVDLLREKRPCINWPEVLSAK